MTLKKALIVLTLILLISGLNAQDHSSKVRIVDLENFATVIHNVSTSSSVEADDFPVYQNGVKQMKKFDDLYMIMVRHDLTASDPNVYICVELVDMEDHSSICEMAKYMRISGATDSGAFSIMVKEINTIQVMRKGY